MKNPTIQPPECVTVAEACRLLSIGKTTFFAIQKSGELPTLKIRGKRLVRLSALNAYIQRQATIDLILDRAVRPKRGSGRR